MFLAALVALTTCFEAQTTPSSTKAIGVDDAVATVDPALKPPKRFALVIGVADYADKRIPDLPACEKDAIEIANTLKDPNVGLFAAENVTLLTNAAVTRNAVVAALDDLARRAGPDDLVLIFYSGHGATDEKGRAYWVMSDARVDSLRATALSELEISELLSEIKTRRLVTLIDACYSAATAELGATKSLVDVSKLYPEFKGDGRVGITASKGDQLSMVIKDEKDPGFGHSAFAFHVIEGLRGRADAGGNADGVVELDELWAYVKDRTIETSRKQGGSQEPQLKGQFGSKFMVAVDAPRLAAVAAEGKASAERDRARVAALENLFLDQAISATEREEGRTLLRGPAGGLGDVRRRRREAYVDVADGRMPAKLLADALAAIGEDDGVPAVPGRAWHSELASLASRFPEADAPVIIAFDLAACAADPTLARAAAAAAAWGWSDAVADNGTPRVAALVVDPMPDTVDAQLVVRGCVRLQRGADPLSALIAAATRPKLASTDKGERLVVGDVVTVSTRATRTENATVSARGDIAAIDRLLARSGDTRPAFTAALDRAAAEAMPVALAADAAWTRERLRRFADGVTNGVPGKLFMGETLAELTLDGDSEFARFWRIATERIVSVAATAEPNRERLRASVRIEFLKDSDADGAASLWRTFLDRLAKYAGDAILPMDVQRSGAVLVLRFDVRTAALASWLAERCPIPGVAVPTAPQH